ncbi:MAG: sn-glycerol-3-phosphate ABC transporter permease UgpE [Actinomycetota bacterium]|jgi:sn-glycerol 3-phosphate transport system permease protein|nr:sn-glycerol-3-phosphate ABC transporter permease UgpE [Actinomycetota bacterium]
MRDRGLSQALRHGILIFAAAIFVVPLYLAFVAATHPARDLLTGVPLLPSGQLGPNLWRVLTRGLPNSAPVTTLMANSAVMALGISIGKLVLSIPAAYAIAFFRFRGRMVAFWLIFITLMLPIEVIFFPTYEVTAQFGLLDSYGGLILPLVASATATFLFRQFFMTFPVELADAARIDGSSPLRFLWSIVLPLSRTNLAAIFVLEFVYGWNQYLWPLIVTTSPHSATVVMGIQEMISSAQSFAVPQWNLVMAVALLAMVPPVLVVVVMQRWFVKGLMAGTS